MQAIQLVYGIKTHAVHSLQSGGLWMAVIIIITLRAIYDALEYWYHRLWGLHKYSLYIEITEHHV